MPFTNFGDSLQSRTSHEALLKLQDSEIKVLENIKKFITQRMKCDQDYSASLRTIINSAQKQSPSQLSTPFSSIWSSFIQENENIIKLINTNTEKLTSKTCEKLKQLILCKKSLRKEYFDEHLRLENDLNSNQKMVMDLKTDYEQTLSKYLLEKAKYEDLYIKGKGGSKFDESKIKYMKFEKRLHRVHNDYIVSLFEQSINQKNYVSKTLPNFLNCLQKTQEMMIRLIKDILKEFLNLSNLSAAGFVQPNNEMIKRVEKLNPSSSYNSFTQEFKSSTLVPHEMQFDKHILDDYNGGALKFNQISVDTMTIEDIQNSIKLYEQFLKNSTRDIQSKEQEKAEMERMLIEMLPIENMDGSTCFKYASLFQRQQKLNLDIVETECKSLRDEQLLELVKNAASNYTVEPSSPKDSNFTKVFNSEEPALPEPIKPPVQKKLNAVFAGLRRNLPTTPPKPPQKDFLSSSNPLNTSNGPESPSKSQNSTFTLSHADSEFTAYQSTSDLLVNEEWFHGVLPRTEVQRLLKEDGDFLVRESRNKTTSEIQYVLSVMWSGHKHFIIQGEEGKWRFEGKIFPTIHELIEHQHRSGNPVTSKSKAIMRKAVTREDWELNNDDIELEKKIGQGHFGDVYKGCFLPNNMEVAVKTCKETFSEDGKKTFLEEGRILKQYKHPNIVMFVGIAAQRQPVMIVMEYVAGGALLNYLRKNGSKLMIRELVKMCEDASAGMSYLESKMCIHRDLAARNCLVAEDKAIKISDFGMSREDEEYTVSDGLKQIPIKWTAPEALNYGKYTSICDVWSFGILCWEVFSLGGSPYSGWSNSKAREEIDAGYRMPAPAGTPANLYYLMKRCWEYDPGKRPHFNEIHQTLVDIRINL